MGLTGIDRIARITNQGRGSMFTYENYMYNLVAEESELKLAA